MGSQGHGKPRLAPAGLCRRVRRQRGSGERQAWHGITCRRTAWLK